MRKKRHQKDEDVFWSKVEMIPFHSCYEWAGKKVREGYGTVLVFMGKAYQPHRISWLMSGKSLTEGLVLDHLCRNPSCVRVEHLEEVTRGENSLRGVGAPAVNSRKVVCPKGHPLSSENLIRSKTGSRQCRLCKNAQNRIYMIEYNKRRRPHGRWAKSDYKE